MKDSQRKRVLVTGGAGFLGSHLLAEGLARTIDYFDDLLRTRGQVRKSGVSEARA